MLNRKRIRPDDRVPLYLSAKEHALLLTKVSLPEELEPRLRLVEVKSGGCTIPLTLDELDELAGYVAFEANHTGDRKLQRDLDRMIERINGMLSVHTDEEPTDDPGPGNGMQDFLEKLPPEAAARIRRVLEQGGQNLDVIQEEIGKVISDLNATPQEDFGGLSPSQLHNLLMSDWEDPAGAIRLNESLSLQDLSQVPMLQNARALLKSIDESGGVRLTVADNLPRKFVDQIIPRLAFPDGYIEVMRRYSKVVNERDVTPLHVPRILLDLAGAIRKAKGKFGITKTGTNLLKEENAGKLYALLFRTHFRKFSLAYLDGMPEFPGVQHTVPFTLLTIGREAGDWISVEPLAERAFLEKVREEIRETNPWMKPDWPFRTRIVQPLVAFGLVEQRDGPKEGKGIGCPEIRKTDLYDRFVRFAIGESQE